MVYDQWQVAKRTAPRRADQIPTRQCEPLRSSTERCRRRRPTTSWAQLSTTRLSVPAAAHTQLRLTTPQGAASVTPRAVTRPLMSTNVAVRSPRSRCVGNPAGSPMTRWAASRRRSKDNSKATVTFDFRAGPVCNGGSTHGGGVVGDVGRLRLRWQRAVPRTRGNTTSFTMTPPNGDADGRAVSTTDSITSSFGYDIGGRRRGSPWAQLQGRDDINRGVCGVGDRAGRCHVHHGLRRGGGRSPVRARRGPVNSAFNNMRQWIGQTGGCGRSRRHALDYDLGGR